MKITWSSLQYRSKFLAVLSAFALSCVSQPEAFGSRNGIEQTNNSFTVGFTFSSDGVPDLCSGALISPTIVVTAAHCIVDSRGKFNTDFVFTPPGIKLNSPINPQSQSKPLKFVVPDGFYKSETTEENEIAFVILDRPLASRGFIRIATSKDIELLANLITVNGYGYGAVYETGEPYSILPRSYSLIWERPIANLKTFKLTSKTSVACAGDSGGPITARTQTGEEILVGVLHSAAFVKDKCGTPANDGSYYMQITQPNLFVSLISSELNKSLITPKPKSKIYKITCVKGKSKKYLTGTNPKCPFGYKQVARNLIS